MITPSASPFDNLSIRPFAGGTEGLRRPRRSAVDRLRLETRRVRTTEADSTTAQHARRPFSP